MGMHEKRAIGNRRQAVKQLEDAHEMCNTVDLMIIC